MFGTATHTHECGSKEGSRPSINRQFLDKLLRGICELATRCQGLVSHSLEPYHQFIRKFSPEDRKLCLGRDIHCPFVPIVVGPSETQVLTGFRGFEIACLVIRIHGCVVLILSRLPSKEQDFDTQKVVFGKIADTAEALFEQTQGNFSEAIREQLVYGMGLVNSLFFAATKCRDYALRRRLLGVLKLLRMAEGTWTSCIAYQIAVHLSSIEDKEMAGMSSIRVIPWLVRPRLMSARFDDASTMTIVYVISGCTAAEEIQTDTFKIRPCEHQEKLAIDRCSIGEYGASESYVQESSCRCLDPGAKLEKDIDATTWQPFE